MQRTPRRWIFLLLASNALTIALLAALGSHYRLGSKLWHRIFHQGGIPVLQPEFHNNPNYHAGREIFRLYPNAADVEGLVVGDSHVANVVWQELLAPHTTIGRGIDGDTADGLLHRLDDLAGIKARWVAVIIGTNDILRGHNAAATRDQIIRCLDHLRTQRPASRLLVVAVPPVADWVDPTRRRNQTVRELNEALRSQCTGRPDVRWLDLHAAVATPDDNLAHPMTVDGVHLAAPAYQILRGLIAEAVADMGPGGTPQN